MSTDSSDDTMADMRRQAVDLLAKVLRERGAAGDLISDLCKESAVLDLAGRFVQEVDAHLRVRFEESVRPGSSERPRGAPRAGSNEAVAQGTQTAPAEPLVPAGPVRTEAPTTQTPHPESQRPLDPPVRPSDFDATKVRSAPIYPRQRPGSIPNHPRAVPVPETARPQFRLPNGRRGTTYSGRVDVTTSGGRPVTVVDIRFPEWIGLLYDSASGSVMGTPDRDGEFLVTVLYRYASDDGRPALSASCPLVITPDPRSLWKDLPSDRSDVHWKPDEDSALIEARDGLRILAASKRGRSHAHTGLFRDDDFAVAHDAETGWSVLAVADGAGSSKSSRRGAFLAAHTAVRTAMEAVRGEPGQRVVAATSEIPDDPSARSRLGQELYTLIGGAALSAARQIEEESRMQEGSSPRDFSTTLLMALHCKLPSGHLIATFSCGDGAIGLYIEDVPELRLMCEIDSGEFAGQTRFLDRAVLSSFDEINRRLKVNLVPSFTALILMTDGVSDPRFVSEVDMSDVAQWGHLWNDLQPCVHDKDPQGSLLSWLDFWSQGNHDDRTIAMLC